MKKPVLFLIVLVLVFGVFFLLPKPKFRNFLFGVFSADQPSNLDLNRFKASFGKNPDLVMIFLDWERFIEPEIITEVYKRGSFLVITWEPWDASSKEGIDYRGLLLGRYDKYISDFALSLKDIGQEVMVRFAHEQNGDWYPWSGKRVGKDTYIALCRYIKGIFDKNDVKNVKWVFSVNWEDIPEDNYFLDYYPGDDYVDYIGIDGYNWGKSERWSKWMEFKDIFLKRYLEIVNNTPKPVLITEFSTSSSGGDKAKWIRQAFREIDSMDRIHGIILFNLDKEADWGFKEGTPGFAALKELVKRISPKR